MAKKETRTTTGTGGKRGQAAKTSGISQGSSFVEEITSAGGTATATLSITHEQIAERAKQIWAQRGYPQGEDERNWREAEKQFRKELGIG